MSFVDAFTLMSINFTNFSLDFLRWSFTPYTDMLGNYFWLLVFAAVIGFTYGVTENVGSVTAAILITFACFGASNIFINEPEYSLFFSAIAITGIAGTVLMLFIKRRT